MLPKMEVGLELLRYDGFVSVRRRGRVGAGDDEDNADNDEDDAEDEAGTGAAVPVPAATVAWRRVPGFAHLANALAKLLFVVTTRSLAQRHIILGRHGSTPHARMQAFSLKNNRAIAPPQPPRVPLDAPCD